MQCTVHIVVQYWKPPARGPHRADYAARRALASRMPSPSRKDRGFAGHCGSDVRNDAASLRNSRDCADAWPQTPEPCAHTQRCRLLRHRIYSITRLPMWSSRPRQHSRCKSGMRADNTAITHCANRLYLFGATGARRSCIALPRQLVPLSRIASKKSSGKLLSPR